MQLNNELYNSSNLNRQTGERTEEIEQIFISFEVVFVIRTLLLYAIVVQSEQFVIYSCLFIYIYSLPSRI